MRCDVGCIRCLNTICTNTINLFILLFNVRTLNAMDMDGRQFVSIENIISEDIRLRQRKKEHQKFVLETKNCNKRHSKRGEKNTDFVLGLLWFAHVHRYRWLLSIMLWYICVVWLMICPIEEKKKILKRLLLIVEKEEKRGNFDASSHF